MRERRRLKKIYNFARMLNAEIIQLFLIIMISIYHFLMSIYSFLTIND